MTKFRLTRLALVSIAALATTSLAQSSAAPKVGATAKVSGVFGSGKPVSVTLHMFDTVNGTALGVNRLVVAHTRKVHALSIDSSLTDYSHSHPAQGVRPGAWRFTFTPKYDRPYHVWLDIKPVGGEQAYVMLALNERGTNVPVE